MPNLLSGAISERDSTERCEIFRQLLERVFVPQRRRLVQAREHSWQSAFVDDDGYFAELIASIVTGVPGVSRRGVSRSRGDLADETEVKKGYRLDPNIDFILKGRMIRGGRSPRIELANVPVELALADIQRQLNANASSVQVLSRDSSGAYRGTDLGVTRGNDALSSDGTGVSVLQLGRGALPAVGDGEDLVFCIRQERGHINFGNKTRQQLEEILSGQPVLVFYHHDPRGRVQIAVVRCALTDGDRGALLDRIYGDDLTRRCQSQPYLFPDNRRDALSRSPTHSVVALGGRLLALAVEGSSGIEISHWDPEGGTSVEDAESLLTAVAPAEDCPEFYPEFLPLDLTDPAVRRDLATDFFTESMDGYYEALAPFCALTSTTRNMSFGSLSQHLVSLVTGVKGTRSGARGSDLVEDDGSPSEIKLATGQQGGDAMATEDSPRLTLGWNLEKMETWSRLFAVRIVDQGSGLEVLVHAPTAETMESFREQARKYFDGRVDNGSGGLQYHALDPFPHDGYGPKKRRLEFARVAQFAHGQAPRFPAAIPSRVTTSPYDLRESTDEELP